MELQAQILGTRELASFRLISGTYASNQVLPRHSHEQAYISVALQGSYLEECGRDAWDCVPGGTIFHTAGESHANRFSDHGARLLILNIGQKLLDELREHGLEPARQNAIVSPFCMQLGLRLERTVGLTDPLSGLLAEGLATELLAEMLNAARNNAPHPDWLVRVKQELQDRFREPLTLTELAANVDVHPVYLARAFRKRFGCSVGTMIRALRADAAYQDLMNSDASIAEIAMKTGFTDQSHLGRVLKRHTGVSPGQVRKARPDS